MKRQPRPASPAAALTTAQPRTAPPPSFLAQALGNPVGLSWAIGGAVGAWAPAGWLGSTLALTRYARLSGFVVMVTWLALVFVALVVGASAATGSPTSRKA